METVNLTQILAESGTTGLLLLTFLILIKTVVPQWTASMDKLNGSMQEVKTEVQAMKHSTDNLLNFHKNGRSDAGN